MKKNYWLIIIAALLSSCASVYFTETQPKGAKVVKYIPSELHGEWGNNECNILIDDDKIIATEWQYDSLTNQLDTTIKTLQLVDTAFLTVSKPYYVYHYGIYGGPWEIAVIEKKRNGDILIYETREPDTYRVDRNLKLKKARYIIDETDTIVHTVNPGFEESISFQSATFSGQMNKKTLKRIAVEANLMYTFKSNGQFIVNREEKKSPSYNRR